MSTLGKDGTKETPKPEPEVATLKTAASPEQSEALGKENRKTARQAAIAQIGAMRQMNDNAHQLSQLAIRALSALAQGHISISSVKLNEKPVVVVARIPKGHGLDPAVGKLLGELLHAPLLELPEGFSIEAWSQEDLDKAGLQKKVRLVDASGAPL